MTESEPLQEESNYSQRGGLPGHSIEGGDWEWWIDG